MYKIDFNDPKHFHFIGIGGVSMSGLAQILIKRGFNVTGSDNNKSLYTDNLVRLGANIKFPQKAENITDDIDCVVYTAAIREDNPELIAVREKNIPCLTRAQFLGQVMANFENSIAVAGTHGKTSTTSMISQVLLETKEDPTISIGGFFSAINSNIHVGNSDTFITEACEYTNSYHEFYPKYSIILNVEEDHLDFFKDINDIRKSFNKFANNTSDTGCIIINKDIPDVSEITEGTGAEVVTFGTTADADCYAKNISYDEFGNGVFIPVYLGDELEEIHLGVPGEHNISNALATILFCKKFGINDSTIKTGLEKFRGADRRFEHKGTINGINVFDDYAHHPTEIKVTLESAKKYPHERVVCVFQPHTYTRTKALLKDIAKALSLADIVILSKIYAAREKDIYNISSMDLLKEIEKYGTEVYYFDTFSEIEEFILKKCINNDLLITMGAGDIVKVADELLAK